MVSRAVGGGRFLDQNDEGCGTSDILLGVNLMEPTDCDDSCVLTCINHVYCSAIPNMLAERLGVKGAIKFVKDMRALKAVPAN